MATKRREDPIQTARRSIVATVLDASRLHGAAIAHLKTRLAENTAWTKALIRTVDQAMASLAVPGPDGRPQFNALFEAIREIRAAIGDTLPETRKRTERLEGGLLAVVQRLDSLDQTLARWVKAPTDKRIGDLDAPRPSEPSTRELSPIARRLEMAIARLEAQSADQAVEILVGDRPTFQADPSRAIAALLAKLDPVDVDTLNGLLIMCREAGPAAVVRGGRA